MRDKRCFLFVFFLLIHRNIGSMQGTVCIGCNLHYSGRIFSMVFYWRLCCPGSIKMKKTTIIMMGVAIIVVLGTELGWW